MPQGGNRAPLWAGRLELFQPIEHGQLEIIDTVAWIQCEKRLIIRERNHLDSRQRMKHRRVENDEELPVSDLDEPHVLCGRMGRIRAAALLDQSDDRPAKV